MPRCDKSDSVLLEAKPQAAGLETMFTAQCAGTDLSSAVSIDALKARSNNSQGPSFLGYTVAKAWRQLHKDPNSS